MMGMMKMMVSDIAILPVDHTCTHNNCSFFCRCMAFCCCSETMRHNIGHNIYIPALFSPRRRARPEEEKGS